MKTLIAKGAAGLLGISGLGIGGYYGIKALNQKEETQITTQEKSTRVTAKDRLKNENFIPLVSGSQHIAAVVSNYKGATGIAQNLKFADFTGDPKDSETAEAILLRNCNSILEKENATDEEYAKAKKWCVEPLTVSELLKKRNSNALSTDNTNHDAQWKEKIKSYRTGSETKIEGLEITSRSEEPTEDEVRNIKEKCGTIGKIKNHEDKFESNLKPFENWCSNR